VWGKPHIFFEAFKMKNILISILTFFIATTACAGEPEIARLKANGMSLGLANEVDSIYIGSGEVIPSPAISGNLTFSSASAKIIPGATDLTIRNNADNANNLYINDAGLLSIRNNLNFTQTSFFLYPNSSDGADNRTINLASGGSASSARGGYGSFYGNEVATVGGGIDIVAGNTTTGDVRLYTTNATPEIEFHTNSLLRWYITGGSGNLVHDGTNGGNLILSKAATGVLVGGTAINADVSTAMGTTPNYYSFGGASSGFVRGTADNLPVNLSLFKSRATDGSANTVVNASDGLGAINFYGADGASFIPAAVIRSSVADTPGTNDMPGSLFFQTTPDGSATPATVLSLDWTKAATFTGTVTSSRTTDLGWSAVNAPNQACNTTCTSACVFGMNTGALGNFVGCADATADTCICAGAS
jgi:hypothetical protein